MTTVTGGPAAAPTPGGVDSGYAWYRLAVSLLIATIGGVGLWSVVVTLPAVEMDFEVARADASLPYTATLIGFALGGILMGRLADRFGILVPLRGGAVMLAAGYALSAQATELWQFIAAQGVLVGLLGSSSTFGPILSDISQWFQRRRGIAVAIAASGSYLAGTVWPPVVQRLTEALGWRDTYLIIAVVCLVTLLPLSALLRRRPPAEAEPATVAPVDPGAAAGTEMSGVEVPGAEAAKVRPSMSVPRSAPLSAPLSPAALQTLLIIAGLACCIAMAMPQVHVVAYCVDLGYGTARGAEMLSLMLGAGILSRLAFGFIADRIGALPTLLASSALQCLSLLLFLPFDGLAALYLISALFGLSQGGIVPTYALVVRQYFPPSETGTRVGLVLSATMAGMAIGGWMSGALYDATLSYEAAFLNGIGWNVLHVAVALFLLLQLRPRRAVQPA